MEFKTFGKKAVSVGLSCALIASTSLTAFAAGTSDVTLQVKGGSDTEPPEIVNIRIPAEIPLTMDEEGAITVEDGLYIENLSDTTGVTVSGISVTGKNGWNIVDYDTDLSGEAENTQKLSMSFNGDGTEDGGAVTLTPDAWDIAKSEQLALTVGAKMPKQNEDSYATKASIATVNYSFSANSTTEPGGGAGEDPTPDEGQITNNWDSQRALLSTGAREVTFSWNSTDESASITEVRSEDEGVATVQKASTFSLTSMDYSGSENWTVTGVGKGKTIVTATLSSGETTQFDVEVYELTSGGSDVTVDGSNVTGGDTLEPGTDLGDGNHDITIDIPITTPDGEDTITVTPEFPEDTVLEEGENNIEVDVVVDGVTIHLIITINVEADNPSNGLVQSVVDAQAMGFTFSSYEDGLQIDSFENKQFKSEVNVPEQIGDFKVLSIADSVFKGQTNLKKITLPDSVTDIGASAFSGCSGLQSINIPKNISKINTSTFFGCTNLARIDLPDTLTSIAQNAFEGCGNIVSLVLPSRLTELGDRCFSECTKLTSIELPDSITSIGNEAFSGCIELTNIDLPDSITSIGNEAFSGCTSLSSFSTGNGSYSVGSNILEGCTGLTSLALHGNITKLGNGAFANIGSTGEEIIIDTPTPDVSFDDAPFAGLSKAFSKVTFTNNCTRIGEYSFIKAFGAPFNGVDLTLPEGLVEIGGFAFNNCEFKTLRLPSSLMSGDLTASWGGLDIENLILGNLDRSSTFSIGRIPIENLSFDSDCTELGIRFYCKSIDNIDWGNITKIGNCYIPISKSITLPNQITSITPDSFTTSEGVGTRTVYATGVPFDATTFWEYSNPYSTPSVNYVFGEKKFTLFLMDNTSVTYSVDCNGDAIVYEYSRQGTDATSLELPNQLDGASLKYIYNNFAKGASYLTSVTIPETVEIIGYRAFYGCSSIADLQVPSSVTKIGSAAFYNVPHITYSGTAEGSPWGAKAIN